MNNNEINNNDVNTNFEFLFNRYTILEKENSFNKQRIKKNEDNIINLKTQLKLLRIEYQKGIKELHEKYRKEFEQLLQLINENRGYIEKKKEFIKKGNHNDKINLQNIYDDIEKIIEKKLEIFKDSIFFLLGKIQEKEMNEIVENKKNNLLDKFKKKLSTIFFDETHKINEIDKNEFKKISMALIIKGNSPYDLVSSFFDKNFNKFNNVLSKDKIKNISLKKTEIYKDLEINLIKKIETKTEDEFVNLFREKYGITKNDFSDEDLKDEIKTCNYKENEIIKVILKKLNYLNEED